MEISKTVMPVVAVAQCCDPDVDARGNNHVHMQEECCNNGTSISSTNTPHGHSEYAHDHAQCTAAWLERSDKLLTCSLASRCSSKKRHKTNSSDQKDLPMKSDRKASSASPDSPSTSTGSNDTGDSSSSSRGAKSMALQAQLRDLESLIDDLPVPVPVPSFKRKPMTTASSSTASTSVKSSLSPLPQKQVGQAQDQIKIQPCDGRRGPRSLNNETETVEEVVASTSPLSPKKRKFNQESANVDCRVNHQVASENTHPNVGIPTETSSHQLDPSMVDAADILAAFTRNIMICDGGGQEAKSEQKHNMNRHPTKRDTQQLRKHQHQVDAYSHGRSKSSDELFSLQQSPLTLLGATGGDNQTMQRSFSSPKLSISDYSSTATATTTNSMQLLPLRRGKWTPEEEAYVARSILYFNQGLLPESTGAKAGMTLRSYLSAQLHCDPMRITKKFTGEACIGKRVYLPMTFVSTKSRSKLGPIAPSTPGGGVESDSNRSEHARAELSNLRSAWLERMDRQEQSQSALQSQPISSSLQLIRGQETNGLGIHTAPMAQAPPSKITRVAIWLDKAGQILSKKQKRDTDDHEDYLPLTAHSSLSPTSASLPVAAASPIQANSILAAASAVVQALPTQRPLALEGLEDCHNHQDQVLEELRELQMLLHEGKDVLPLMSTTTNMPTTITNNNHTSVCSK